MKLELFQFPKTWTLSQGFGGNGNDYYRSVGLLGHSGLDYVAFWRAEGPCLQEGVVIRTLNKDNKDPNAYKSVSVLVSMGGEFLYCQYGHFNEIKVSVGQKVKTGETLGYMGNSGPVYVGGKLISAKEKRNGSKAGTHIHFTAKPMFQTAVQSNPNYMLQGQNGNYKDDYYYIQKFPENGYWGAIDPQTLFNGVEASIVPNISALSLLVKKMTQLLKSRR